MNTSIANAETRTISKNASSRPEAYPTRRRIQNGDVELKIESGTLKYEARAQDGIHC